MRGSRALLAAARAPSPLERLLACIRIALSLMADALRPSGDPQDTPVMTLGHHYISVRDVADPEAPIGAAVISGAGGLSGAAQQAGGGAGAASAQLRLQEICTFDPAEGPKRYSVGDEQEVRGWVRVGFDWTGAGLGL